MFAAISKWFQGQTNTLDRQHAKVSWDEALDNAIYKIGQLSNVESETGKENLALILDELKLKQLSTQSLLDEIYWSEYNDQESAQSAQNGEKIVIFYDLPWDGVPNEQARKLTKEIYALGVDEESLLMQPEEREYQFDFDIDHYIVLAQIMLKIDKNLKKSRHELVPEIITEDDFWHNYFYKIEMYKREMGLQTCRLGQKIALETRVKQLKAKQQQQ